MGFFRGTDHEQTMMQTEEAWLRCLWCPCVILWTVDITSVTNRNRTFQLHVLYHSLFTVAMSITQQICRLLQPRICEEKAEWWQQRNRKRNRMLRTLKRWRKGWYPKMSPHRRKRREELQQSKFSTADRSRIYGFRKNGKRSLLAWLGDGLGGDELLRESFT